MAKGHAKLEARKSKRFFRLMLNFNNGDRNAQT